MIEKLNNREKQYIILLVIFSGLIMLVGLVYCITHLPVPTMIAVGGFMIYSLIIVLIKPKTLLGKRVHEIFATPVGFILYQMQAVAPSIGILSAYLFSGVMCAVPALCVYYPWHYITGKTSPEWFIFLLLSFTTILMSTHTELEKKCMMSFGVWNAWAKNDAQKKLVVIGAYMLQTENVHFVCSMLYVVFLICLSVKSVLNIGPLISPEIDNAVWKAFLVYVALVLMR